MCLNSYGVLLAPVSRDEEKKRSQIGVQQLNYEYPNVSSFYFQCRMGSSNSGVLGKVYEWLHVLVAYCMPFILLTLGNISIIGMLYFRRIKVYLKSNNSGYTFYVKL